jgi:hypothetical protein
MAHPSPLACDLTALDPAQRERRGALAARLTAARAEIRELPPFLEASGMAKAQRA